MYTVLCMINGMSMLIIIIGNYVVNDIVYVPLFCPESQILK